MTQLPVPLTPPARVLVLINERSGGQAGRVVARVLRRILPSEAVCSLGDRSMADLAALAMEPGVVPVAAGGDGTVVSLLEAIRDEARRSGRAMAPVGILPLGTGNDLATTVGWPAGAGHAGRIQWCINELQKGRWAWIDRWTITGPGFERAWYNYCSWGCDARVAQHFHASRRDQPWLFRSRLLNRALYGMLGLIDQGSTLPLGQAGLRIPAWARSVVLTNIPFYAGGGCLGAAVRADDGFCDGFALGGGLLLGLGTRGLRAPHRLGRYQQVTFELSRRLPMQLDGEPLSAGPGRWTIAHGGRVPLVVYPGSVLRLGDGPRAV
jgi:diacylglycerol kinase (ATP)